MPLILLEKCEEIIECGIRYLDFLAIKFFNLVLLEKTSIKIWHLAQKPVCFRFAVFLFFGKALKKERAEEILVIPVFAAFLALAQTGTQVIIVIIEKNLFLDEIDKHKAVQHNGYIHL